MENTAARPVELIDIDFGDTDFKVTEYPDGMFEVEMGGTSPALVVNAEQFKGIVLELARVGKERGWV